MDYPNHITNHEKGKHLTYEDYVIIELRLKDGWKPNAFAKKELNCSANTVRNIIKKGMTPLYEGNVQPAEIRDIQTLLKALDKHNYCRKGRFSRASYVRQL